MKSQEKVYLGIGSNSNDAVSQCRIAYRLLDESANCRITARSGLLSTEPWGLSEQNWFTNGVIEVTTSLSPFELLERCQKIEIQGGRERRQRWGPRTIDIDILLWPGRLIVSNSLTIPHPRMHERRFVLHPLSALIPDEIHPLLNVSIQRLFAELEDPLKVFPLEADWR